MKMQASTATSEAGSLLWSTRSSTRTRLLSDLNSATLLVDVGLTSMDMVNLMLAVEAEFDFTIPQSEITPENFQSVETLQQMIVDQLKLGTTV